MKNRIISSLIILSLLFLIGASPWEGAASLAPDGELPATGMFVATNSFPVNTVVDITNIETNKSTRVIVAKGLDSPGLLALVSREAADIIGMRGGSIGRIRMVQPSDPIAYLRFIEGQAAGIPAYDSGNVLTEPENGLDPVIASTAAVAAAEPMITGPSYVLEPEWQNREENIITLTEEIDEQAGVAAAHNVIDKYDEFDEQAGIAAVIYDEEEEFEEEEPLYIVEDEIEEEEPLYIVEDEIEEEEPLYIAEEEDLDEMIDEEPEYIAESEEEEPFFVLVPAEENPPEDIYGIDPNDIIPEITESVAVVPVTPVDTSSFSVPRVTELDRGYYYVQLAALDRAELVENTLSGIDRNYKPVVYKDGDTWYRILLGPMNQGESAAVLARFKSIGYKDAFVRHAR